MFPVVYTVIVNAGLVYRRLSCQLGLAGLCFSICSIVQICRCQKWACSFTLL